ncbi:unnamed protein product, partial [Musa textilis]
MIRGETRARWRQRGIRGEKKRKRVFLGLKNIFFILRKPKQGGYSGKKRKKKKKRDFFYRK